MADYEQDSLQPDAGSGRIRGKPKGRIIFDPAEVKRVQAEEMKGQPTFWWFATRFMPVWLLIGLIIFIEPTLPFQLIAEVVNRIGAITERDGPPSAPVGDSIFVVEGSGPPPLREELPEPTWDPTISPIFTDEVQYWEAAIGSWSYTYRIPPNMIATIMQIESCGNPDALSPADAQGLFQVLQLHFEPGEDPFDPNVNAMRAMLFFGDLLATTNFDTGLAFAAYNGGPSLIYRTPVEWPRESQQYQYWASGIYEEANMGLSQSPTLIEWLAAGGVSLCSQAADALGIE
jgi:hypothetical protein